MNVHSKNLKVMNIRMDKMLDIAEKLSSINPALSNQYLKCAVDIETNMLQYRYDHNLGNGEDYWMRISQDYLNPTLN